MPLHIVLVEDSASDAELIVRHLQKEGLELKWDRVETRQGFLAALAEPPDLILADYSLPSFSGLEAISLLKKLKVDVPVILVSGTVGEEVAVEAMKEGAHDYLLKDRLTRLGPAVRNALHEKSLREEKRSAEEALRASEERYRLLFESNPMPMWVYDTKSLAFLAVNAAAVEHYGYTHDEFLKKTIEDIRPQEELGVLRAALAEAPAARQRSGTGKHRKRDGTLIDVEISSYDVSFLEKNARLVLANDITERRQAEVALQKAEAKYRSIFENAIMGIYQTTPEGQYISANAAWANMFGYDDPEELLARVTDLNRQLYVEPNRREVFKRMIEGHDTVSGFESEVYRKDGSRIWISEHVRAVRDEAGILLYFEGIAEDITARKRAEEALRQSEANLAAAQRITHLGSWELGLENLENPTSNAVLWSDEVFRIFGYEPGQIEVSMENILKVIHPIDRNRVLAAVDELLKTGRINDFDCRILRPDGTEGIVRGAGELVTDPGGRPLKMVGIVQDITEPKQIEDKLRLSDQILQNVKALVLVSDSDGTILYASPSTAEVLGYSPEALLGEGWWELTKVDREEAEKARRHLRRISRGEVQLSGEPYERRIRTRSGEMRWILWQDAFGPNQTLVGVGHDVTERKRAEEAVLESEKRFRNLFENSPVAIWEEDFSAVKAYLDELKSHGIADLDAYLADHPEDVLNCIRLVKVIDVNQAALRMHKAGSKAELLASLETTFTPQAFLAFRKELLVIASGERSLEMDEVVRTLNGEWRDASMHWLVAPDHENTYSRVVVSLVDITERKRAEEALRAAESRYRTLIEQLPMIVYIDSVGDVYTTTYVSPQIETILGYSPQEWMSAPAFWRSALYPEDREAMLQKSEISLSTGKPFDMEYRMIARDGHVVWFHDRAILIHDANGQPLFWQGLMIDINERKRTEEAVRAAESKYRSLVEQLPMVVYITSFEDISHTIYISPQIETMLGYPVVAWLEDPTFWEKVLHPEDHAQVMAYVDYENRTGQPFKIEYRMIAQDGHAVWFQDEAVLIRDSEGRPLFWQGLMVDITERKLAEERMNRQDQELQQRNAELTRLYRASESLLSGALVDLPSLAQTIVQTVLREFSQSNCSLLLVNRETRELERLAVEGPFAQQVGQAKLSLDGPGVVAKATRTGQVINVPEAAADPDYISNWEAAHSELVIPLRVGDEVIGALDVQSPESDAFHKDDERLMTIFGERAALALERTRLHEQTKRQLEQLEGLRTIDLAISNSLDLRISLNIVLEQVVLQLGVDAADVLLMKPGLNRLEYVAGRGFRTRVIESTSLRLGEGYAGRAALEKQIFQIRDLSAEADGFTRRELLLHEEFVCYFCIPLIAKGEVRGVLEIFHRRPLRTDMEWLNFLDALGWQTAIAVDNALLFEGIQRSNFDLAMAYDATIEGWSRALDLRDKETEGHTQRVTEMTLKLAQALGFRDADLVHIRRGALLHDIGKMGVPDNILLKAGPLTVEEWDSMKRHPQLAYDMLQPIAYLRDALNIPYCHHEKWDGTGYPRGLAGAQIPLEARVFAIVDVWDAITSDRPYRKKWTEQKALKHIHDESGKHFDPDVVKIFLKEIIGK